MSKLYQQVCTWENFNLAWRKAARGKRGREPAASFEYRASAMVNEFTICYPQKSVKTDSTLPGGAFSVCF